MLALVTGIVLVLGGLARFGAVADLVSKPVMTGFLFGLGLTIALAQLPSLLGVDPGEGNSSHGCGISWAIWATST